MRLGSDEHRPTDRRELGYTRQVCAECGTDWPCIERPRDLIDVTLLTDARVQLYDPATGDTLDGGPRNG